MQCQSYEDIYILIDHFSWFIFLNIYLMNIY